MLHAGLRVEEIVNLGLGDVYLSRSRENLAPAMINWDLIVFRNLNKFLLEEGYNIHQSMNKMSLLDEARRLPRPLPDDQVRGHEDLDTTVLYAEVADPLLQKDYYQGISAFDPASSRLVQPGTPQSFR